MTQRIKFTASTELTDAYDVMVQDKPRARWQRAGIVARYGSRPVITPTWAALGANADAWSPMRRTRSEAVADMLAGVTFRTYQAT